MYNNTNLRSIQIQFFLCNLYCRHFPDWRIFKKKNKQKKIVLQLNAIQYLGSPNGMHTDHRSQTLVF
jgi:hypothetical protein